MEKIIEEKMQRQQVDDDYQDAFDLMLAGAKEQGQELNIQELKVQETQDKHVNLFFCITEER